VQDPWERRVPGLGLGRDPERTPMQWDAGPGAGFTTGAPWLPLGDDYAGVNVAAQRHNPRSALTLARRLIALRRAEPALSVGGYAPAPAGGDLLAYTREADVRRLLVALNLGGRPASLALDDRSRGRTLLSTHLDREGEPLSGALELRGDEGVIAELEV
jgi:alpha-glucosidase